MESNFFRKQTIIPCIFKFISCFFIVTNEENLYFKAFFLSVASMSIIIDLINYINYKKENKFFTDLKFLAITNIIYIFLLLMNTYIIILK